MRFRVCYRVILLAICTIWPKGNIISQNVKWAISGRGYRTQNICDFYYHGGRSFISGYCDAGTDAIFGVNKVPAALPGIASTNCYAASCDTLSNWKWAGGGGGGSYLSNSIAITADENNNAYVTGFTGRDFFYNNILFSAEDYNYAPIFLAKHNKRGDLQWLKRFGQQSEPNTLSDGAGTGLAYSDGYIYTLGFIQSGGVFYNIRLSPPVIYLAKFDTLGNFIWAKSIARCNYNFLSSRIVVNSNGNLLITGLFNYSIVIGNDTLKNHTYYYNSFICEVDTSGNVLFAKKITDSMSQVEVLGLGSDKDDNVYLTGAFRDTLKIDSTLLFINLDTEYDGFILKLNGSGELVWGKQFEGLGVQIPYDLAVSHNELFCTGYFTGEIVINNIGGYSSGYEDIFLIKLDADNGDLLTGYIFGDGASGEMAVGIELDTNKNVYLAGAFNNQLVLGNEILHTSSPGDMDVFVFCFDEYGILSADDKHTISGNSIKIYPNPASDFLIVETQEVNLPVLIEIYDTNGRILFNKMLHNEKELIYRESTGIKDKGIYIVRLSGKGFQKIEKLIWE